VSYGDAVPAGEGSGRESLTLRMSASKTKGDVPEQINGHEEVRVNGISSQPKKKGNTQNPTESPATCGRPVPRLIVLAAETMSMEGLFDTACTTLVDAVLPSLGSPASGGRIVEDANTDMSAAT